jgi:hypothetical protein
MDPVGSAEMPLAPVAEHYPVVAGVPDETARSFAISQLFGVEWQRLTTAMLVSCVSGKPCELR